MKSLFTIHAGEFVVGDYIERKFRRVNLWVPSRDTGMDLLVTNSNNEKAISLQIKFSRDFLAIRRISHRSIPLLVVEEGLGNSSQFSRDRIHSTKRVAGIGYFGEDGVMVTPLPFHRVKIFLLFF